MAVYAVIETGGKQYRVGPGDLIDVERLEAPEGSTLALEEVRLVVRDGEVFAGTPRVEGVRVLAQVVEHFKGPKVVVFKYKAKTRYRRKRGHRQLYTRLRILEVQMEEGEKG